MQKLVEAVFGSRFRRINILALCVLLVVSFWVKDVEADIGEMAITEGLVFSFRSLDLIECTNRVVPEIIREITRTNEKSFHNVEACLESQHFQRSMMGLALSFGSGDDLQYNKVKCPRLIASFLRDKILGYSCPYLSKMSELFNFVENKELKMSDSIGKRSIRTHQSNARSSGRLPTIQTSLYTRLIQSCNRIEKCLLGLEKAFPKQGDDGLEESGPSLDVTLYHAKVKMRQSIIDSIISQLPKKIGRRDILTYSNNLLRRATFEFETNFGKESPLDPFWIVQTYRMLLIYSVMLNSSGIFVNLSSHYFKEVFNYLLDTKHLHSIDSLQLQTKYLNLDKFSRKQLLFLRASYTILESCFIFWKDLHNHYVSSVFTSRRRSADLAANLDFSQICQKGFQLPLRQTLIFFYYTGIKEVIKYSDTTEKSSDSSDFTELTENPSTDSHEWSGDNNSDSCIYFTTDTPWFIESTSLFYPATSVEELDEIYRKEVSALIKQSDPSLNPKATVLNLNSKSLSGYFIGGTGSMMYKSCTYYLKRKLKLGSGELILAQVTKMSKKNGYREVSPTENIRYFCWYTAKVVYPNDSTFEAYHKYETNKFSRGDFKVSQALESSSTSMASRPSLVESDYASSTSIFPSKDHPISSSPRRFENQGIEEPEAGSDKLSSFSQSSNPPLPSLPPRFSQNSTNVHFIPVSESPAKSRRYSSFLDKRRKEILRRLYPQSFDLDMNSLAYSISDSSNDLKGVPVIKKHYTSPHQVMEGGGGSSAVPSVRGKSEPSDHKSKECKPGSGLIPKLLEEIRSGVKLRPTGSSASNEIMDTVRKEIKTSASAINLGVSSSQIKNDLESTEFAPPIIETSLLDEMSNNHKLLFEQ